MLLKSLGLASVAAGVFAGYFLIRAGEDVLSMSFWPVPLFVGAIVVGSAAGRILLEAIYSLFADVQKNDDRKTVILALGVMHGFFASMLGILFGMLHSGAPRTISLDDPAVVILAVAGLVSIISIGAVLSMRTEQ